MGKITKKSFQKIVARTEKEIEKEILFWLNQHHSTVAIKHETQGQFDPRTRRYRMRHYQPGVPGLGAADIFCAMTIHNLPIAVFFEVKRPKTGKVSPSQIEFKNIVENNGGFYFVVTSIEDTQAAINKVKSHIALQRVIFLENGG